MLALADPNGAGRTSPLALPTGLRMPQGVFPRWPQDLAPARPARYLAERVLAATGMRPLAGMAVHLAAPSGFAAGLGRKCGLALRAARAAMGARTENRVRTGLALCAALWLAAGCAGPGADGVAVGRTRLALEDPQRPRWDGPGPRPVVATLWYRAEDGVQGQPWAAGPFLFGRAVAGAAPARHPGARPLIVMSHGTGGSAAQLSWLAEALVARGYPGGGRGSPRQHRGGAALPSRGLRALVGARR
ncbi:hypothetical protein [Coralloluteibacterium stylophorae]|nr:hypothetical protein [Coralloluteibacterium stylophorae]MBS7456180.1 hypothetical protein [Coralloluteibacterium stylophorae]